MTAIRTDADFNGQGQPAVRAVVRPFEEQSKRIAFGADEVHVWVARIESARPAECFYDLSESERARATGYVMPRVRDQFVVSRSVLRRLLSRYLGPAPNEVDLTMREDGKPVLADAVGLHFNVAHSGGWVAVAVAGTEVGVDLETVRDVPNAGDLVKRFFAPAEREQYESLPATVKRDGFLRGWTCKEAVLKGVGAGMRAVDACAVCLDPSLPPRLIQFHGRPIGERWGLGTWRPAEGMVAAVAVKGSERVEF